MNEIELQNKLFLLKGSRVVYRGEPHLKMLLSRGQQFSPKGHKRRKGEPNRCHQNVAFHYAQHHAYGFGKVCDIVTGYALSDGFWRQHSWLWDGNRVLETTTASELYFGVILEPGEASRFVVSEIVARLPGFEEMVA